MFKVICIDDKWRSTDEVSPSGFEVKEGCTYTVVGAFLSEGDELCYELDEDPDCPEFGHQIDRFIKCSSIDETELLEQRKEQFVTTGN